MVVYSKLDDGLNFVGSKLVRHNIESVCALIVCRWFYKTVWQGQPA
jgi:hypothetical protein